MYEEQENDSLEQRPTDVKPYHFMPEKYSESVIWDDTAVHIPTHSADH